LALVPADRIGTAPDFPIQVADGNHCEILADFDLTQTDAERIGFEFKSKATERPRLVFDLHHGDLIFDRTEAGGLSALKRRCPLESASRDRLQVRILIDSVTVEVFTDSGGTVLTNSVYSGMDSDGVAVFTKGGRGCRLWMLRRGLRTDRPRPVDAAAARRGTGKHRRGLDAYRETPFGPVIRHREEPIAVSRRIFGGPFELVLLS
jgi:hypothetical protein